jgi:hypothetical protein
MSAIDNPWDELLGEYPPLWDEVQCEFCGCTEMEACPGGCAWSKRYQDRAVCTNCEHLASMLELNMGALEFWRHHAISAH